MGKLDVSSVKGLAATPLGPGALVEDLVEKTPDGFADAVDGDSSAGRLTGMMTEAPTFTASPEIIDLMEDVVGNTGDIKGSKNLMSTQVQISGNFIQVYPENLKMAHPALEEDDWLDATHSSLEVGTGDAKFKVRAREGGTNGDNISLTLVDPAASTTAISITVSSQDISVTLASDGTNITSTAQDVVNALNLHLTASSLIRAGIPSRESDGSGLVAALTQSSLAGGAEGSRVGTRQYSKGYIDNSDYIKNIAFGMESNNTRVNNIIVCQNVISVDDFEFQPSDDGNVSGISFTLTAHADEDTFDPATGVRRPPFEFLTLDPVVTV